MNILDLALIGNPNCGKTTLFNALTGSHQRVGNWPGVTVDRKTGFYLHQNEKYQIVDLPGTYGIESLSGDISQDEVVARNYVIEEADSLLINIVDATNLQRNLYLTFQLVDLRRPMIVVLNMVDALKDSGKAIDIPLLETLLGCPVLAISAAKGTGIKALKQFIATNMGKITAPQPTFSTLSDKQETVVAQCLKAIQRNPTYQHFSRWHLLEWLLTGNSHVELAADVLLLLQTCRRQLLAEFSEHNDETDIVLASSRFDAIDKLCGLVISHPRQASKRFTYFLDKIALGRVTGVPIFLIIMYLMFFIAINFGSVFIDFFDIFFTTVFVDGTAHVLSMMHSPSWLIAILADGVGSGIKTVATFIPVIAAMFLCLSFLEDSGYLARAAMVVDRGMRAIGLPGKAFVPMLVGFGCNVPAIMGTRMLESRRDRLISIMMIPFISCGARLPVYALFAAIFFAVNGQNIVFLLYIIGIVVAIFTGFILKFTLLPGENSPFVMELPPYHVPTLKGLLLLTWERLKGFILKAGKAIILMVVVLSVLNSAGTDGSFGHQDTNKSVLSTIGRVITPIFHPMGIKQDNWPATVGIFTGVFAKESVIGTLNSLYSQLGQDGQQQSLDQSVDVWQGFKDAVATIKDNFIDLGSRITDPLGMQDSKNEPDKNGDVASNTLNKIHVLFGSEAAAFAYLIFILLYTPCAATLGAVYREAGGKWMAVIAIWTLIIGWVVATGYFQVTQLGESSSAKYWLIGLFCFIVVIIGLLRLYGKKLTLPTTVKHDHDKPNHHNNGCCS